MEQRSLKVLNTEKTFFTKITSTISKLLIPTRVGINGIMITIKRNNLLKAYEAYNNSDNIENSGKKEEITRRYEESFVLYLESIDKHIMESVYKKVKNNTATEFEKNALSKYYTITHLKETEYLEYKYRKQKYLLELDYETIINSEKTKIIQRYKQFYITKMDSLYKGILKNYSIQLADSLTGTEESKKPIYTKIFSTLEEYIQNILPIKMEIKGTDNFKTILDDYDEYQKYLVGKLDEKDIIEKNMVLLGISRQLFTHSLPLIAAEQCYTKLLKDTKELIVNSKNENKKESAFSMLKTLIEDYNVKLLSTKVYWSKPEEREEYKQFWEKCKSVTNDKEKEVLFIKNDLKQLQKLNNKNDKKIIKEYKGRLVELGAMRVIKDKCKTINKKFTKKKILA